jgi:hypothetical protein
MRVERIQDRISWGLNVAARSIGAQTDAYRPRGADTPLAPAHRFLRLHAAFGPADGGFSHTNTHGTPLWRGYFDAEYTQPGDYLVQQGRIFFVAAQPDLLPVLCVLTNRIVSFHRPSADGDPTSGGYGGLTALSNVALAKAWPASVLGTGGDGYPQAGLPTDTTVPRWTVLLPVMPDLVFSPSDLMTDDLGRSAIVTAAEPSELGWRLSVRQATT